jgi:hypothetical protein
MEGEYVPFYGLNVNSITSTSFPDPRLGGGGLFGIEILLLSLLILVISFRCKGYKYCVLISLILLFSSLLLPFGYAYRYYPYYYLIPIIALIMIDYNARYKAISRILSVLLCLNLFVTMSTNVVYDLSYTRSTKEYIKKIKQGDVTYRTSCWSFLYKLNDNHYVPVENYVDVDERSEGEYSLPKHRSVSVWLKDKDKN